MVCRSGKPPRRGWSCLIQECYDVGVFVPAASCQCGTGSRPKLPPRVLLSGRRGQSENRLEEESSVSECPNAVGDLFPLVSSVSKPHQSAPRFRKRKRHERKGQGHIMRSFCLLLPEFLSLSLSLSSPLLFLLPPRQPHSWVRGDKGAGRVPIFRKRGVPGGAKGSQEGRRRGGLCGGPHSLEPPVVLLDFKSTWSLEVPTPEKPAEYPWSASQNWPHRTRRHV